MADYLLGIDNGGTITKVVIFDIAGNEVISSSRKVTAHYPNPGWTERSMHDVWTSTSEAIRESLEKSGINPADIVAIGNTAHGNGIYLVDEYGEPVYPGIISTDNRAGKFMEALQKTIGDDVWKHTYQKLWASSTGVLLAWFHQHMPDIYNKAHTVILGKDYVKYKLTGDINSDYTDISAANLLDLNTKEYSEDLFRLFDLPEGMPKMPELFKSTDIAGRVSEAAAEETGLVAGTPVAGGILDVIGTALGAGVVDPGQACIIAGTWSINEVVLDKPIDNSNLWMNCMYGDATWMAIEASPTSASNLEWFIKYFCAEEKQEAEQRGISVYDVCNEKVAKQAPGSVDILFHPFLFGSNVQATARAGFYGMGNWHNRDQMLRAVYEGIVYSHLSHIEDLRKAGIQIDVARFAGGAARSEVWAQMFADALGFPIEVVEGDEMGTRGAAICAGIAAGVYSDFHDAVGQAIKVQHHYEPNPEFADVYRARFDEYQFLTEVMREAWNRIDGLASGR